MTVGVTLSSMLNRYLDLVEKCDNNNGTLEESEYQELYRMWDGMSHQEKFEVTGTVSRRRRKANE